MRYVIVWTAAVVITLTVYLWRRASIAALDEDLHVTMPPILAEQRISRALELVPDALFRGTGPGQMSMATKVVPAWIVFLAIIFLPLGLLLLLVTRDEVLHIRLWGDDVDGTQIHVSGRAKRPTATRVVSSLRSAVGLPARV